MVNLLFVLSLFVPIAFVAGQGFKYDEDGYSSMFDEYLGPKWTEEEDTVRLTVLRENVKESDLVRIVWLRRQITSAAMVLALQAPAIHDDDPMHYRYFARW
ncbi:hypothetical protein BCR42DRAFT_397250 [Absidia repens]|uniref:Uncharacterized protein n=1 Tax=Absidia repens TaxID=90262 RepID=A0A1X2I1E9_9FUNG|nr:hypothetical protein BCR42DRAFT_397250 [Absidia repens]